MNKGCLSLFAMSLLVLVAVFQLTGCEVSNPQTRTQKHPDLLNALSSEDRDLVLRGTISEGMTKDAVFLAWGKPDSVVTGSENGRQTETWRYASLQAVYHSAGFGLGMGYNGFYHHRGRVYPTVAAQVLPDYVPVTSSVVRFRNGRVVAWETSGR